MGARMPFSSAMLAAVQWVLLTGLGAGRRAASTLQVLYRSFQLRLICLDSVGVFQIDGGTVKLLCLYLP